MSTTIYTLHTSSKNINTGAIQCSRRAYSRGDASHLYNEALEGGMDSMCGAWKCVSVFVERENVKTKTRATVRPYMTRGVGLGEWRTAL